MDSAQQSNPDPFLKPVFPKIVLGLLILVILVLGIEGYSYWQLTQKRSESEEETDGDLVRTERSLYSEVKQDDGSTQVNILGKVRQVSKEESFFILENTGEEEVIFVNEETLSSFIETSIGYQGLAILEKIIPDQNITVASFSREQEGVIAQTIFIFPDE